MLGTVQRDVQQQSRLLCGSVSQQYSSFQEKLGSRNILWLQSALCPSSPIFSGPCSEWPQLLQPLGPVLWYKYSGWPCLELVQTWTLHFPGEVSPCIAVHSQYLGQQQECETELAVKTLQLVLQRYPQQLFLERDCHTLPVP